MGVFFAKPKFVLVEADGKKTRVEVIEDKDFDNFNPSVLGLGDISLRSKDKDAVAAALDLSGFTNFCSQVDPQLSVPEYLSQFLDWLFSQIRTESLIKSYPEGKSLYCDLPFLSKFLGDGILFLWDCKNMGHVHLCNIIVSLRNICFRYKYEFYPNIIKIVNAPPSTLRCGIARGKVFSVGNGEDFVGPCINIASRLQKLSLLNLCFSRRGFDIKKGMTETERENYVVKLVTIRGIGDELVGVIKNEFDSLPKEEKALFKDI